MKKLFIITDVHPVDRRYYIKDKVIGTVIRAEVAYPTDSLDGKRMVICPNGSAFGYALSDDRLWYDDTIDNGCEYWCHASITVKPLQED
jgi:hypothetical protein